MGRSAPGVQRRGSGSPDPPSKRRRNSEGEQKHPPFGDEGPPIHAFPLAADESQHRHNPDRCVAHRPAALEVLPKMAHERRRL